MLRRARRPALCVLLLSFASTSGAFAEPVVPRFLPLGDLPGDRDRAAPLAVSTDGSVVIGNGVSTAGPEAFRWTAATGAVGLGDLPGGGFFSVARAATPDGSVVAGTSASDFGVVPFRWTAAAGMQTLVPHGAGDACEVSAISRGGDAVVGTCRTPFVGLGEPFPSAWIWTSANGFAWIAGLPWVGGDRSAAFSVSDDRTSVFGWVERGPIFMGGSWTTQRDVVRFEAGADGAFGTTDDRRVVLDPYFVADEDTPIAASADGTKAVGIGERRGALFAFLWSAGGDRKARTADDSFRSIAWRGTTAICVPLGISADGRTPFGACVGATGPIFPARWDAAKGWLRLGTAPRGAQAGYAVGASADGRTLVGFFEVASGPAPWNLGFKPFRWTATGGLSVFGTVTPEDDDCDRCVVVSSDGGDVLGAEGGSRGDGLFLWTAGRGRRHVDELAGDWQASYGSAMSDDGLVVAGKSRSADGDRAFRWSESAGLTPVGPAGVRGMDVALSDDGATLFGVVRWDVGALAARTAFFHRAATGAIETLGAGFAGSTSCYPTGLSGDGAAVVGDCLGGVQAPAFRWTQATGLVPLQLPTDHNDWWCSAAAVSRTGAVVGLTCQRPIDGEPTESRALLWSGLGSPLRDLRLSSAETWLELVDLSRDGDVALGEKTERYSIVTRTGFVVGPPPSGRVDRADSTTYGETATLDLSSDGGSALFQSGRTLYRLAPGADSVVSLPSPAGDEVRSALSGRISGDGGTAIAMFERRGPTRAPHLDRATRVWIWDATNGGRWLDEALASAGVDLTGWSLEEVVDTSADGKRLLGNGIDPDGRFQAWVVVLP